MKNILTIILLLTFYASIQAQYKGVAFEYERAVFNENQPLPAETHIMLQGNAPKDVVFIELDIFDPKGKKDRKPLYTAIWKRPYGKVLERFNLPINYKLKGSAEYDFNISYYKPISNSEKTDLANTLFQHLDLYIEQTLGLARNNIKLNRNVKQMLKDLNSIVDRGLSQYRNRTATQFEGFSDIIRQKLEQIEDVNLAKGRFLFNGQDKDEARQSYREKVTQELKQIVFSELKQLLNVEWSKVYDSKYIDNYSTEKRMRIISLQGGFSGVYLSGDFSNLAIGAAPFVGLSFPLGRKAFAPKILSNTSITFGAYLLDFQGANNTKVSGPIFKRPTYIGLSYKIFRFVQFNFGATFLEDAATAGQFSGIGKRVYIRPNIGISIQLNLWMDLAK